MNIGKKYTETQKKNIQKSAHKNASMEQFFQWHRISYPKAEHCLLFYNLLIFYRI